MIEVTLVCVVGEGLSRAKVRTVHPDKHWPSECGLAGARIAELIKWAIYLHEQYGGAKIVTITQTWTEENVSVCEIEHKIWLHELQEFLKGLK